MEALGAVLRSADGEFELETIHLDEPRFDEALIKVVAVGFCHTDNVARAGAAVSPVVFGHEGAGIVEEAGPGSGVSVGDHVLLSFASCGACRLCRAGEPSYCEQLGVWNFTSTRPDGSPGAHDAAGQPLRARWFGQSSFATHCLAHRSNMVVVDKDLPLEVLAPMGCGFQTGAGAVLNAFRTGAGDALAVFGAGGVGLAAVMAGHVAGARAVVAVDIHPGRLDLAQALGATHVIDGRAPDVAHQIRSAVGDVDAALDTTGVSAVVLTALSVLRPRGQCGMVGAGGSDILLPSQALGMGRTLTYMLEGNAVPQVFLPTLIDLWRAGRFPVERLIQHYSLADVNLAEKDSLSGAVVKPVLLPQQPAG